MTTPSPRGRLLALAPRAAALLALLAAAPVARADVAVVKRDLIGLRVAPDASAAIVDRARDGERLTVLEKRGGWLRVTSGVATGWVPGGLVTVEVTGESPLDPETGETSALAQPPRPAPRDMPAAPPPVPAERFDVGEPTAPLALADAAQAPPVRRHVKGRAILYDGVDQDVTIVSVERTAATVVSLDLLSYEARRAVADAVVRGDTITVVFDELPPELRVPAVAVVAGGQAWR